jgi:diguanylate cyclase (GGDEF)-like protein
VQPTNQTDTPRLTIVASSEVSARQPSEVIDPIRFLQAITSSVELDQVMAILNDYLRDLVGHTGWEYRRSPKGMVISGGKPDRHRLEYSLNLNGLEMGTLTLMRGRRFSESDQARIEGLLGLAATALHNALRFHDLTELLERDSMTGLGNRRALTLQGAQWLANAVRHKKPLSMLVLDIDRFKTINDTHGHPLGDRVLCSVADTLRSVTRAADLCVRMGGDEFVVVLPETNLAAALDCAERIRRAIDRSSINASTGEPIQATVSIGVASHRPWMDLDQLYRQADDALYAAKRAGSNRVLAGPAYSDV